MLKYELISELVNAAQERKLKISELVLSDQAEAMEQSPEELYERMRESFQAMRQSVAAGMREDLRSMSGLTGGEGCKMQRYAENGGGLCGPELSKAVARAVAVAGCNAAMGRIVAAPTAGSCGILPGCLVSLYEDRGFPERDVVMSMFTAGAFGMVIAARASIAGAQGGCQAECGSAAAMAAAALVELMGGTPEQCAGACAIAVANQLGLVCDPVAGLVEVPCIKRNAGSVMQCLLAAELALAGVGSFIPADEAIDAMDKVGRSLPGGLRETAEGGLAVTSTAKAWTENYFKKIHS